MWELDSDGITSFPGGSCALSPVISAGFWAGHLDYGWGKKTMTVFSLSE